MVTKEERKDAILQKQMEMAMEGSVEMLKWVGINLCGQSNRPNMSEDELPLGFDVQVIKTREQEEFEEYRDEFLEWKEKQDDINSD